MKSKDEKHLLELASQLREPTKAANKAPDEGLAAAERTQQEIHELRGALRGKTNGACLTIEEINDAIAVYCVLDDERIRKGDS